MIREWLMQNWLELFGTISGLIYLYLEIRQKTAMWVLGFITSLVYVAVFFRSKFYADMGLNIYYVVISVYGFLLWYGRSGNSVQNASVPSSLDAPDGKAFLEVRRVRLSLAFKLLLVSVLLFVVMGFVLDRYTDSPVPYYDALTTALSIVATWMLARKYLDHWFIWFFVNFISMSLYIWRGLYPTSVLFFFYGVMSVVGYLQWKKTCITANEPFHILES